jgi:hypothetical protein
MRYLADVALVLMLTTLLIIWRISDDHWTPIFSSVAFLFSLLFILWLCKVL